VTALAVLLLAAALQIPFAGHRIMAGGVTAPVRTCACEIRLRYGVASVEGPPGAGVSFGLEARDPATGAWAAVPAVAVAAPIDVRGRADPRTGLVTWRIAYGLVGGATSAVISVAYSVAP